MKRAHCILLAILMVVCLLPMTTTAASTVWDGTVATAFAGGAGTELDPYQIATGEQLAYFAQRVNTGVTYGSKFLVLTDDIVLNDTTDWQSWSDTVTPDNSWTPIGTSLSLLFAGTFDGDNHTVSGMYVNWAGDLAGLFGFASPAATIKNLGVIDSYVKGEGDAGAIVAQADGPILNCYNTGTVVGRRAGGICGDGLTSSAIRCWNSGTVTGTYEAGGIMGESVIGTSLVLGRSFEYCYNKGTVTAVDSNGLAGGIVGDTDAVWIVNCYNEGSISSQTNGYAGGLAGNITGTTSISGAIEYSYNVGSVTGTANRIGLIAGQVNENTIFTNTYYLDDATSLCAVGQYTDSSVSPETYENNVDPSGTEPFTDAQMQAQINYANWDFTDVWGWAQVGDEFYPYAYPILRPEQAPPAPNTLALATLGGAARFDKTAIRFGAALFFDAIVMNATVGDVIDYGFHINGIDNGTLTNDNWIKLSAASTAEGYTGLVWTEEMAASTTTEQLMALIRAAGSKVYSCDGTTLTFAIILDNLPTDAQDSLWVFESYLSVNGFEISQGAAKYNSVNRILEDMPSSVYDPA